MTGRKTVELSAVFFVAGEQGEVCFFSYCEAGRSYCEPSARAELCRFWVPLLGTPQEVAQERRPDVPSGASLGIATLHRGTRKIKYTFNLLCLNASHHAWQGGKARAFVLQWRKRCAAPNEKKAEYDQTFSPPFPKN